MMMCATFVMLQVKISVQRFCNALFDFADHLFKILVGFYVLSKRTFETCFFSFEKHYCYVKKIVLMFYF